MLDILACGLELTELDREASTLFPQGRAVASVDAEEKLPSLADYIMLSAYSICCDEAELSRLVCDIDNCTSPQRRHLKRFVKASLNSTMKLHLKNKVTNNALDWSLSTVYLIY